MITLKLIAVFLIIKSAAMLGSGLLTIGRYKQIKSVVVALFVLAAELIVFALALRYLVTGEI